MTKAIICFGLPRSGSTWAFNVTARLLGEHSSLVSTFSNDFPVGHRPWPGNGEWLLVKTHVPSKDMIDFCTFLDAKWLICVRDPRDCVVSAMEAFHFSRDEALIAVQKTLDVVDYLSARLKDPLLIRYEDISDRRDQISRIARHIGIPFSEEMADQIQNELSPNAVKELIARSVEEGLLDEENPGASWLPDQHWHPNHVGDGETGKYRAKLSGAVARRIFQMNAAFFQEHRYDDLKPPAVRQACLLQFNGDDAIYLEKGFSFLEEWGVWTDGPEATLAVPVDFEAEHVRLELTFHLAPSFPFAEGSRCRIMVNGEEIASLESETSPQGDVILVHTKARGHSSELRIAIFLENMTSPAQAGLSNDKRLLGIGIKSLRLTPIPG